MTAAAAYPARISRARLGPVRTPAGWPGRTSPITWDMRFLVPCSRPLARLTIGIHGLSLGEAACSTDLNPCEGTPITSTSACSAASSREAVALSDGCSDSPARYSLLVCRLLISLASSGRRAQMSVGARRAATEATVDPQDPAPRTVTRISRLIRAHLYCPHGNDHQRHRRVEGQGR